MIKVEIKKSEIIDFLEQENIKKYFNSLWDKISLWKSLPKIDNISYEDFKNYFSIQTLNNQSISRDNEKLLPIIYKKISSNWSNFYSEIRKFIIEKFTENIKFCPYCWKVPLISYSTDSWKPKERMFQFDHFLPKSKYKNLTISFYNLIPCCNGCNHKKWNSEFKNNSEVFHPYFWWIKKDNLWNIMVINEDNFCKATTFHPWTCWREHIYIIEHGKYFKIPEIYENAQDTNNDLKFIHKSIAEIKVRENLWFDFDWKENIEMFFEHYAPQSENEILKFSNGKFKKDLIDNLKLPNN